MSVAFGDQIFVFIRILTYGFAVFWRRNITIMMPPSTDSFKSLSFAGVHSTRTDPIIVTYNTLGTIIYVAFFDNEHYEWILHSAK